MPENEVKAEPETEKKGLTPEEQHNETVKEINRVLDKLRPYLQGEGGDLQYVDFVDGVVYIRLLGACVGCGSMDYTLKDGIEALMVEYVPEVIEVRNVDAEPDETLEDITEFNHGDEY